MAHLLKAGVAWDAIMQMSEQETYFLIGVLSALQQKEQDAEAKSVAPSMGGMSGFGNM